MGTGGWCSGCGAFGAFPDHFRSTATNEIAAAHAVQECGVRAMAGEAVLARLAVVGIFVGNDNETVAPAVLLAADEVERGCRGRSNFVGLAGWMMGSIGAVC